LPSTLDIATSAPVELVVTSSQSLHGMGHEACNKDRAQPRKTTHRNAKQCGTRALGLVMTLRQARAHALTYWTRASTIASAVSRCRALTDTARPRGFSPAKDCHFFPDRIA
jgi:hypothetical protein